MNARNAFNPDLDECAEFPKLKAAHGEDPARFLQSSKDLAFARIRGIRDPELLTAYAAVAKQILTGSEKRDVLEAIDNRERDLAGEPIAAEPEPVPATDGGTAVKSPAEPEGSAEPDDVHPDTEGLVAGEVLVLAYADRTDYIFPATPACETPYLLRAFDAEGDERTDGPLGLTFDEVKRRTDGEEPTPVGEIDVRPPTDAATKGGSQ